MKSGNLNFLKPSGPLQACTFILGKYSIDSLQKAAILGISHIIQKVLQCETGSLSSGDRHWFKRSTMRKKPVTRDYYYYYYYYPLCAQTHTQNILKQTDYTPTHTHTHNIYIHTGCFKRNLPYFSKSSLQSSSCISKLRSGERQRKEVGHR
jgi:hypothetical protein